jgi:hypothetical protein
LLTAIYTQKRNLVVMSSIPDVQYSLTWKVSIK